MLTAWGFAGIAGPTLIARIREYTGAYRNALYVIAAIMLVSAIIRSSSARRCRRRRPRPRRLPRFRSGRAHSRAARPSVEGP